MIVNNNITIIFTQEEKEILTQTSIILDKILNDFPDDSHIKSDFASWDTDDMIDIFERINWLSQNDYIIIESV